MESMLASGNSKTRFDLARLVPQTQFDGTTTMVVSGQSGRDSTRRITMVMRVGIDIAGEAAVTPGNVEFVQVLMSMSVCTGGVAAILHADERRPCARSLPPRSPRAWLPVTRDAAIFGTFLFSWLYGAPALVIHFVKSRWSLAGLGMGLLWAIALVSLDVGAQFGAAATIDWLGL